MILLQSDIFIDDLPLQMCYSYEELNLRLRYVSVYFELYDESSKDGNVDNFYRQLNGTKEDLILRLTNEILKEVKNQKRKKQAII